MAELIVASGSSSTDAHLTPGVCGDEDLHYLIDFDMAFLGDSEEMWVSKLLINHLASGTSPHMPFIGFLSTKRPSEKSTATSAMKSTENSGRR